MDNEFRYRLLKAIADKGISASELSRLSGVGKSDISNYINGAYVAKSDKCYLLARALDVDPGWLMTGDEPLSYPEPEEFVILSAWRSADKLTKDMVRRILGIEERKKS